MGDKGEGSGGEGGGKRGEREGNWEWGTPCPPPLLKIVAILNHCFLKKIQRYAEK